MTQSLRARVARKALVADGICAFDLVPAETAPFPSFTPGAHIDVKTPAGDVRQYSLCNSASDEGFYRIAVLREESGRGGSRSMHSDVMENDVLSISEPRNHFALDATGTHSLLFAGGIGITPLLSMAQHLRSSGRDFTLHYCTRSDSRTAFKDELTGPLLGANTRIHLDDGPNEQKLDLAATLRETPVHSHLYVCGPSGFIDAVLSEARKAGWTEARLHREFFAATPIVTDGDRPFDVVVASSGAVVHVASDQTVVAALAGAGIEVMTSCEQGVCGTCVTRVLEGIPEHRDCYFTDEEHAKGDQFTPCCSRARSSRLVLDL